MIRQKVLIPILLVALIVVGCATSPSPEPSQEAKIDKVAIGILDVEIGGTVESAENIKKILMNADK